ncbi:hypothetical protein K8R33_01390 [archaeon]|nr:hypothetical protein [archaeon]
MAGEQTQPQFIFWVKEAGVFRPAEPKMPENYIGYNLENNIELGEREISPESLNLVSSVYLGPVNIFEEDMGTPRSNEAFERLKQHRYNMAYGIVRLAEEVAKEQIVPYFAVNVVKTSKERTWKFVQQERLYDEMIEKNPSLVGKFDKLRESIEFILHPTAQLYVPRE